MADQPPSLPQTSSALPPSRTEPLAIWSLVLAILLDCDWRPQGNG